MTTPTEVAAADVTEPVPAGSVTSIRVALAHGRVRVDTDVTSSEGAPCLRPMLLSSDATSARISLVPDGAMLLAGDAVRLAVEVGPGATLTLVEPGGTVAYDMAGGSATWDADLTLREGATLIWPGEPLVLSAGCDLRRTTRAHLAAGARLAVRETVVLGRHGEAPGRATIAWSAYDARGPLLVEELVIDDRTARPGALGAARVLGSVTLLSAEFEGGGAAEGRLDLDRGGTLWRHLVAQAHLIPAAGWQAALAAAGKG